MQNAQKLADVPALPPRLAADFRRHKRFRLNLHGRFMRSDRQEFDCALVDISVGGAAIQTEAEVSPGERIIVNFPDLGSLHGSVFRIHSDGFAMSIDTTPRRREKLANQITWLVNRDRLNAADDSRRVGHRQIKTRDEARNIVLPDGTTLNALVRDISVSGISLNAGHKPDIGTVVGIGKLTARVIRHHDSGFAAEFLSVQRPASSGEPTEQNGC